MRERSELEKKHLPETTYDLWLRAQSVKTKGGGHRTPVHDLYESWIEERVRRKISRTTRARTAAHSAKMSN